LAKSCWVGAPFPSSGMVCAPEAEQISSCNAPSVENAGMYPAGTSPRAAKNAMITKLTSLRMHTTGQAHCLRQDPTLSMSMPLDNQMQKHAVQKERCDAPLHQLAPLLGHVLFAFARADCTSLQSFQSACSRLWLPHSRSPGRGRKQPWQTLNGAKDSHSRSGREP
jgi:hypothetical protein